MENSLQRIRKSRGFASAKEFYESAGIPAPTYSRYEANPERIPMERAWQIADALGCTIDEVVGRHEPEDFINPGPVQEAYDRLAPDSREFADGVLEYLRMRDEDEGRRERIEEEKAYEEYARHYERLLLQRAATDGEARRVAVFGTDGERREAVRALALEDAEAAFGSPERAAEVERLARLASGGTHLDAEDRPYEPGEEEAGREAAELAASLAEDFKQNDLEKVDKVMEGYDRLHGARGGTEPLFHRSAFGEEV